MTGLSIVAIVQQLVFGNSIMTKSLIKRGNIATVASASCPPIRFVLTPTPDGHTKATLFFLWKNAYFQGTVVPNGVKTFGSKLHPGSVSGKSIMSGIMDLQTKAFS